MKRKIFLIGITIILSVVVFFKWNEIIQSIKPDSKQGIARLIKQFSFSDISSLGEWREKIIKGKVEYELEKTEGSSYIRAKSLRTASALYHDIKIDIKKRPILSWKWRVDHFPKRNLPETIEGKKEEDFAARVYVMFPAAFFTNSKAIEYIWAETLPKNTIGESGYSKNIKVIILESGKSDDWVYEKRNIYEDYVKLFNKEPKLNVGAIAFMTDSDSTKTEANAVYDEIEVGYEY